MGSQRDQLKVVFIETQYIDTDAVSFKSVVQTLTGKDSSTRQISCLNEGARNLDSPPSSLVAPSPTYAAPNDIIWTSYASEFLEDTFCCAALPGAPPALDKLSSFRDFERMISQLPPVDEMYSILEDNL